MRCNRLLLGALCCAAIGWLASASSAEETLGAREERAIQTALARVAPSVVRIETVGGLERVGQILVGSGPTTGLIVSADGLIVSSAFNFAQKPDSILVTLPDGKRQAAKLVATDHSRMLVLLKVQTEGELPLPEVAPLASLRVGQWALAVGRTFDVAEPNVSVGIVSALDRIWGKAVQTDAKVSPNNYGGPLVDVAGRVIGVLVPMSPQGSGEVAGVEWYDSGIGFAAPLETVMNVLPKWREGHNLDAGLLGVSMQGADIFSQPPVLAAVRASGPAYKAGLRAGDKIVEANHHPITRQAELKHQLGPRYAGEKVTIVATRGDERLEREIELTDKIEPYEYPFLGVLPKRPLATEKSGGVVIRFVYPDSPAARAGLQAGDRIRSLNDKPVENIASVLERFQALVPDEKLKLEIERGGQASTLEATLGRLPETIPAELPPADDADKPNADKPKDEIKRGVISVKVPEFEQDCVAYVPESYREAAPHGLVVWLHGPGGIKETELIELWKPVCEEHGLVLLAPKAADRDRWEPTEARFIRRAMDQMLKDYSIDRARVVVHGYQGGAAMAYLVGATSRDVVRAVAAIDAPLPRVPLGETDPVERLAFLAGYATKTETTAAVQAGIARLRALKFPVSELQLGEQARYLTAEELDQLVRWIDSLDRF